jgi:hypothetical protein
MPNGRAAEAKKNQRDLCVSIKGLTFLVKSCAIDLDVTT